MTELIRPHLPARRGTRTAVGELLAGLLLNRRVGRFVIVGGALAGLFLILSYLLTASGLSPFLGCLVAYALAFAIGYLVQRCWTFESDQRHSRALPRYFILQAGCALLSGLVAQGSVDFLGLPLSVMSVLTAGFAGVVSFVVSSTWVFPDRRDN